MRPPPVVEKFQAHNPPLARSRNHSAFALIASKFAAQDLRPAATMPKASSGADARHARRHNPLAEDYAPSNPLKQKAAKRKKTRSEHADEQGYVDSKASQKILKIGQDLAEEEETELESRRPKQPNPAFDFDTRFQDGPESDEDEIAYGEDDDAWGDEDDEEIVEEVVRAHGSLRCSWPLANAL